MPKALSIVFPTYNRGRRLFQTIEKIPQEILSQYPVIVIDNCSTLEREFYKKISDLAKKTIGLEYIRQDSNVGLKGNIISAFNHVKSDFFMVLSDEDKPCYDNLDKIQTRLLSKNDIGAARVSTGTSSDYEANQVVYPNSQIFEPGYESMNTFGLWGNYLSGGIFNTRLLRRNGILEILRERGNLQSDYPHVVLYMLASAHYKTMLIEDIGCYIGKPEEKGGYEMAGNYYFGPYSYGSRVDQFLGFRNLIVNAYDSNTGLMSQHELILLLVMLCKKYITLVCGSNMPAYKRQTMEPKNLGLAFLTYCISSVNDIPAFAPNKKEFNEFLISHHNWVYENIGLDL